MAHTKILRQLVPLICIFLPDLGLSKNYCNVIFGTVRGRSIELELTDQLTCNLDNSCKVNWSGFVETGEIRIRYIVNDPDLRTSLKWPADAKDAFEYKINVHSFEAESERMHQQFDSNREIESTLRSLMSTARANGRKVAKYSVAVPPPGFLVQGETLLGLETEVASDMRGSIVNWSALSKAALNLISSETYLRQKQVYNHFLFLASPIPGEPPLPTELEWARQQYENEDSQGHKIDVVKVSPNPADPEKLLIFEYSSRDGYMYHPDRSVAN